MASYCLSQCIDNSSALGACVNGVPTPCTAITDGSHCMECPGSCPTGSHRCDAVSDHCVALLEAGAGCSNDSACISNNCGAPQDPDAGSNNQCLVAGGMACTPQNCAECDSVGVGGSSCAKGCQSDTDCPVLDHSGTCHGGGMNEPRYWVCLGSGNGPGGYFCRRPCSDVIGNSDCPPGWSCSRYQTPLGCDDYLFDFACLP
jgi:hypothetical protein